MNATQTTQKAVKMGAIRLTCGINDRVANDSKFAQFVYDSLKRHAIGDWSEMDPEDQEANAQALADGSRIFSAYSYGGVKIWIITEWDRHATTVLFPDEY